MFFDRSEAGRVLAGVLPAPIQGHTVVVGLTRGGVIVAASVASQLELPIDCYVVRKLGAPGNPEYAIGALAEDGPAIYDETAVRQTGADAGYREEEEIRQRREIDRQVQRFRGGNPLTTISGVAVVVVDDGIATGSTVRAAVRGIRVHEPRTVTLAAPVAAFAAIDLLRPEVDDLVIVEAPKIFWAVGHHYTRFEQVSDEDVVNALGEKR